MQRRFEEITDYMDGLLDKQDEQTIDIQLTATHNSKQFRTTAAYD